MSEGRDRVVGPVGKRARPGQRILPGEFVDERLRHVGLVIAELQNHRTTLRGVCVAGFQEALKITARNREAAQIFVDAGIAVERLAGDHQVGLQALLIGRVREHGLDFQEQGAAVLLAVPGNECFRRVEVEIVAHVVRRGCHVVDVEHGLEPDRTPGRALH